MRSHRSQAGLLGALALVLGILLAACGGEEAPDTPVPQQGEAAAPTAPPESKDYFAGKTIRVVIPYSPGGSSSILVPYFSHQVQDYIPGAPRVVSAHITPVIAGYNYTAKAPTDGSQILYTSAAPISQQYAQGSEFDVGAFQYLIGYTSGESIMMVNRNVPYNDIRQAASTGHVLRLPIETDPNEISGANIGVLLAAEAMGFKVKMIPLSAASTGTPELLVALERGDLDGLVFGAIWYTMPKLRPGWTKDGVIKPVGFLGRPGQKMAPNTETDTTGPSLTDEILNGPYPEEIKQQYRAFVLPDVALGKHFLAPPGTNPEAVRVLRKAFSDMLADANFVKGLERLLGSPSVNVPGDELQTIMESAVESFGTQRDQYDPMVKRLYDKYTK